MSICLTAPRPLRASAAARRAVAPRVHAMAWARAAAVAAGACAILGGAMLAVPSAPSSLQRVPGRAAGGATVLTARAERESGYVTVVGEARNAGTRTVDRPEAVVELIGSDGAVRSVEAALAEVPSLRPGERSSFRVLLPDVPEASSYRVHVRALTP